MPETWEEEVVVVVLVVVESRQPSTKPFGDGWEEGGVPRGGVVWRDTAQFYCGQCCSTRLVLSRLQGLSRGG